MSNSFDSLHSLSHLREAEKTPRPVLLQFGAAWCTPCRRLSAALERVAGDYDVVIRHVDIEKAPEFAAQYHVRSVPTLVGLRDGAVALSETGFSGEARLRTFLARLAG